MVVDLQIYISDILFWISKALMGLTVILGLLFGALLLIEAKFNIFEMSAYTLKRLTKKWGVFVLIGIVICTAFSLLGLAIMPNAY
ncbi:hypothetical protein K2V74_14670 [Mammaliicoccus sciuri]|uniref:hypothetical protein n=1 Tax=Mammaliicoccus sciuri TaxID=1296 RepID=UPI0005E740F8|nr:hypothetical protein [Mammaliicoccus sciuri]MCD8875561.1 hypothetical protein [Mammaliicoccus sciuri]CPQ84224.1 Uncharacterised protein [Staphylococcus aureus]